jgi:hypothetical protein
MKKELIMMILIGAVLMAAKPVTFAEKKSIVGSWKCVAKDVPEQYMNSLISVTEKEGKLVGTVKFDSGSEISLNYVKQNGSDVTLSVYVEGNEVIIKCKVEGSKITGTADTPDGTVSLTATRAENKK